MKSQQWTQMMIDKLIYSLSQELCVDESYIQEIIAYKLPNETTDWINHLSEFDLSSFMKKKCCARCFLSPKMPPI